MLDAGRHLYEIFIISAPLSLLATSRSERS
ncbi:hypothetical protein ABID26_004757 [Mesorhizobium shonense]|uniref:Uncharacterized protein n=1 Tax=Mesorhizobium shonense TaxID=1209948 RepID=A0ABV2HXH8_9HYPH